MNADVAKPPIGQHKWKAIDIFLFSNGQQYSPPRKYHLKSEDLNWWSLTLNHLARLHYGSLYTNINLYTTNGKKIQGPLELLNGSAYVAVKTPDAFIDSGYDKYLMKASRSWEKRHSLQCNNVETEGADDINVDSSCRINMNVADVKKIANQNVSNKFKNKSAIVRLPSNIRPEPRANKLQESLIKKDAALIVPNRRSRMFQRNSTRTSEIRSPLEKIKDISANKAQNVKVITKFNKKNVPIQGKDAKMKIDLQKQLCFVSKHSILEETTKTQCDDTTSTINTPETLKSDDEPLTLFISGEDCELTENITHLKNTPNNSNRFLKEKYNNNLRDKVECIFFPLSDNTNKSEICKTDEVQDLVMKILDDVINLKNSNQPLIKNGVSAQSKHDIRDMITKEDKQTQQNKTNYIVANAFAQQYGDQMNFMSKGVIFHLKVSIEVNNDDEIQNFTEIEPSQEKRDDTKVDKTSQVKLNFSEEKVIDNKNNSTGCLCKCDENQEEINAQNIKTTVSCHCNNLNIKEILSEDSKYMIIVLPAARIANLTKCEKCSAKNSGPKYSNELCCISGTPSKAASVTSVLKKTSDISVKGNLKTCCARAPCYTQNLESERGTSVTNTNAVLLDGECIKLNLSITKISCNASETQRNSFNQACKCFSESSTQTDWCNLLLEARSNKDGHYTFHLPSLQVINVLNI